MDPDDTYNETPYEKGYAFVCYLQHLVGDVKKFDDFLKDYVDKFKFQVNVNKINFLLACYKFNDHLRKSLKCGIIVNKY